MTGDDEGQCFSPLPIMRTLGKVLFWWFIAGAVVTTVRGYIASPVNTQQVGEPRDAFFQKLMMTYPPRTQTQIDCLNRLGNSNTFLEHEAEERVVSECKLQKLTPEQQARLKREVERFAQITQIPDEKERFAQLKSYYSTHPNLWIQYGNFCRQPLHTESGDCDYYRHVMGLR